MKDETKEAILSACEDLLIDDPVGDSKFEDIILDLQHLIWVYNMEKGEQP